MALDFPNAPTIGQVYQGYVWDGAVWQMQGAAAQGAVRYDIAQGLTANQKAQGRANIDATKQNKIINGAMMVSQENGATAGTINGYFPVDMFSVGVVTTGAYSVQQVASPTPGGSPNRIRFTVTAADTSIASGEIAYFLTKIEGQRSADLKFGTAAAKTVTLQFGVKAPAGNYGVSIINQASNRANLQEYVIAPGEANIDVVKTLTFTGDVTGTWTTDTAVGFNVFFGMMAGSQWQGPIGWSSPTSVPVGTASQFNIMGTNGNVFELFDVGLYEGTVAPAFMVPDVTTELVACQRYWRKFGGLTALDVFLDAYCAASSFTAPLTYSHFGMRSAPTWTLVGTFNVVNCSLPPTFIATPNTTVMYVVSIATGQTRFWNVGGAGSYLAANARL